MGKTSLFASLVKDFLRNHSLPVLERRQFNLQRHVQNLMTRSFLSIEPRKKPSYFPLYCLVNRDPYNGLLYSLYHWVVCHPLYNTTYQGPFFRGSIGNSCQIWSNMRSTCDFGHLSSRSWYSIKAAAWCRMATPRPRHFFSGIWAKQMHQPYPQKTLVGMVWYIMVYLYLIQILGKIAESEIQTVDFKCLTTRQFGVGCSIPRLSMNFSANSENRNFGAFCR